MRTYISGPLQASSDLAGARALYETIAAIVVEAEMEPYVPHLHTDPELAAELSPAEVYRRDVEALLDADVIIAHVGAPSTGVGAELALAARAGIRIIAVSRRHESVSRFALGLIADAKGQLISFTDGSELRGLLLRHLTVPPACLPQVDRHRERLAG